MAELHRDDDGVWTLCIANAEHEERNDVHDEALPRYLTVFDRAFAKASDARYGITLHEGRHTFASLMIAAGVNAKALSTYMGHSSVVITLDRYGHLMPGSEGEAAGLLDTYLDQARASAAVQS